MLASQLHLQASRIHDGNAVYSRGSVERPIASVGYGERPLSAEDLVPTAKNEESNAKQITPLPSPSPLVCRNSGPKYNWT